MVLTPVDGKTLFPLISSAAIQRFKSRCGLSKSDVKGVNHGTSRTFPSRITGILENLKQSSLRKPPSPPCTCCQLSVSPAVTVVLLETVTIDEADVNGEYDGIDFDYLDTDCPSAGRCIAALTRVTVFAWHADKCFDIGSMIRHGDTPNVTAEAMPLASCKTPHHRVTNTQR